MSPDPSDIQSWLSQFSLLDRDIAISLLLRIKFIPTETLDIWLKETIAQLNDSKCGLYAARKFSHSEYGVDSLWDKDGNVLPRPGTSLGSEDHICSVIHNITRKNSINFFDHPSIHVLREKRIKNILIIDDSIGSGHRISDYIQKFFKNKTIMSWWSYGVISFYIISYARTKESTYNIIQSFPGSNHGKRKIKKTQKVHFICHDEFSKKELKIRWGDAFQAIYAFCKSHNFVKKNMECGYDNTMSNIIFYHSVPNNTPGCLWSSRRNSYKPLFSNRTLPIWLINLLESKPLDITQKSITLSQIQILQLIKKGIRKKVHSQDILKLIQFSSITI